MAYLVCEMFEQVTNSAHRRATNQETGPLALIALHHPSRLTQRYHRTVSLRTTVRRRTTFVGCCVRSAHNASHLRRMDAVYGPTVHRAIMTVALLGRFAIRSTTPPCLTNVPQELNPGTMETVERVYSRHRTSKFRPSALS